MASSPVTMILIEDDESHAFLIEKNLQRAGIDNPVVRFADGASALAHLFAKRGEASAPHAPMLILLDLNLPDMGGIEILEAVKADLRLRRVPVVVLTSTQDKAEIDRCYRLGASACITKPVTFEDFAAAIRQLGHFLAIMKVPAPR